MTTKDRIKLANLSWWCSERNKNQKVILNGKTYSWKDIKVPKTHQMSGAKRD